MRRLVPLAAIAGVACVCAPRSAQSFFGADRADHAKAQVVVHWLGGSGDWSNPAKWSGGVVPNNGTPVGTTYAVSIDGGNAVASSVTLDTPVSVDSVTVDANDVLTVAATQTLTLAAGPVGNAGSIQVTGTIALSADISLSGGGTVTVAGGAIKRATGVPSTPKLTNLNNTIQGAGTIGQSLQLDNQGTIAATSTTAALTIIGSLNPQRTFNSGTIRAQGGARLVYQDGQMTNTGGLIRVDSSGGASTVEITTNGFATSITGGTVDLTGAGAGTLRLTSATLSSLTLTNNATGTVAIQGVGASGTFSTTTVTNAGTISVGNASELRLGAGTYSNSGTISLAPTTSFAALTLLGDVTLTGGGTVSMSAGHDNRIRGSSSSPLPRLTNMNNTIEGSGTIGDLLQVDNRGTIAATSTTAPLTILGSLNPQQTLNSGTIRAQGGARLVYQDGQLINTGGLVRVDSSAGASTVEITTNGFATSITGGTVDLTGAGAGTLRLTSATLSSLTLTNNATGTVVPQGDQDSFTGSMTVTNAGTISIGNAVDLRLAGTYANSGTIALAPTTGTSTLTLLGDVTLSGGGAVALSDAHDSRINGTATSPLPRLTNMDNTISGAGTIGDLLQLDNRGTIAATSTTAPLTLLGSINPQPTLNSGTIRAQAGARLVYQDGAIINTGGLVRVDSSSGPSTVELTHSGFGVSVSGGSVDLVGTGAGTLGLHQATLANLTLTNTPTNVVRAEPGTPNTFAGAMTINNDGVISIENLAELKLPPGTYTNSGAITLNSTGGFTTLRIAGDVSLVGAGGITFNGSAANRVTAVSNNPPFRLTNVNNGIAGTGTIGDGMDFTNQGSILVSNGKVLTLDTSVFGFTTSGAVTVIAGGRLVTGSNVRYTQTGGLSNILGELAADGGVLLQGGTIKGFGTITGNVTNSVGSVTPGNPVGTLTVNGNYTQTAGGTLGAEIGGTAAGQFDVLDVRGATGGTAMLGGTLALSRVNGFSGSIGQTFRILSCTARSGTFSAVTGTDAGAGRLFSPTYNPADVTIAVTGGATSVAVTGFTARWSGRGVVLTWRTRAETGIAGFDVLRNGVKLNRSLIAARHAGEVTGAAYRFVDRTARKGVQYTYRLRVVAPTRT